MQFITTLCVLLSILYTMSCIHMYTVVSYVGAYSQGSVWVWFGYS